MRKIWIVAMREYRAMVATKAFLLSVAMMPIMMFGGLAAVTLLKKTERIEEHTIAVVDGSGQLVPILEAAATAHNAVLEKSGSSTTEEDSPFGPGDRYVIESVAPAKSADAQRLELSDQVREGRLYAFVEIPASLLSEAKSSSDAATGANQDEAIRFYATDAALSDARRWIGTVVNEFVSATRLRQAGMDPSIVQKATQRVEIKGLGLFERDAQGQSKAAIERSEMSVIFLPMICMMLMFMVIFMASQPMLESVLEEKSSRVVEVLLGSVNPSQLMTGKLIGTVAGSLTIFAIYLVGGIVVARSRGLLDAIPLHIVPWFVTFQILGVMLFAAIFMAVGSSVSQLKEAQSMLLPVWLVMMLPLFVWFNIVRKPNSTLATVLTFFPPAAPSTLILRMATGAVIPIWQILVSLVLLILTTIVCVILAGRIFRVGVLWQGKTPRMLDLLRWSLRRA